MAPATAAVLKHPAELAVESATKAAAEASGKLSFYAQQRRALEQQVDELREKYNAACRAFAAGDGTDPSPARDELSRAESRLHGTIQLHVEWDQVAQPLVAKQQKAELQFAWQKANDELADLLKAELEAKAVATAAIQKGDEMAREHGKVVYAVGLGRKKLSAIEAEMRAAQ